MPIFASKLASPLSVVSFAPNAGVGVVNATTGEGSGVAVSAGAAVGGALVGIETAVTVAAGCSEVALGAGVEVAAVAGVGCCGALVGAMATVAEAVLVGMACVTGIAAVALGCTAVAGVAGDWALGDAGTAVGIASTRWAVSVEVVADAGCVAGCDGAAGVLPAHAVAATHISVTTAPSRMFLAYSFMFIFNLISRTRISRTRNNTGLYIHQ
ncbi:MAG: hypothetical protein OXH22_06240 [Chloroflexi bacterium]|nr:hypothetical protein [Chloroflexota bacterium]